MKRIIVTILFLSSTMLYSQLDSVFYYLPKAKIDSIQLSIWKVQTKETSSPSNPKEYQKQLKKVTLKLKDQQLFINTILDAQSYDNKVALLYHYNIFFEIYNKSMVTSEVKISTITGNVYISNKLNKKKKRDNCSKKGASKILFLLKSYKLLKYIDEFELKGVK